MKRKKRMKRRNERIWQMKILCNDFIVTYSSKMLLTVIMIIMIRNYIFLIIINTTFPSFSSLLHYPDPQLAKCRVLVILLRPKMTLGTLGNFIWISVCEMFKVQWFSKLNIGSP